MSEVLTDQQVLKAFDDIRRHQRAGEYAPHKPLLLLLALGRLQRRESRWVEYSAIEDDLKALLNEFGRTGAAKNRHYPFWHLATDGDGAIWTIQGPATLLSRPPAATPSIGELRAAHATGAFSLAIDHALRARPPLVIAVAQRVLDANFPVTLHGDIAAAVGLDMTPVASVVQEECGAAYGVARRRNRDPSFRERVLRAYEFRCCVCGFDLRIGQVSAGLEAAHIQWHNVGGPDIEPNGLALCSLHHKLFDLGAFTVEPGEYRVVFSQHAMSAERGLTGELRHHGTKLHMPQVAEAKPGPEYLAWNLRSVFKSPARGL